MAGSRLRDGVILIRVGEHRTGLQERDETALQLRPEALQVIGTQLVDRDHDDEPGLGSGGGGGGGGGSASGDE